MSNPYAHMPQFVQEDCYHLVRSCIQFGVSVSDLKAVLAELWQDALHEKARHDRTELSGGT